MGKHGFYKIYSTVICLTLMQFILDLKVQFCLFTTFAFNYCLILKVGETPLYCFLNIYCNFYKYEERWSNLPLTALGQQPWFTSDEQPCHIQAHISQHITSSISFVSDKRSSYENIFSHQLLTLVTLAHFKLQILIYTLRSSCPRRLLSGERLTSQPVTCNS